MAGAWGSLTSPTMNGLKVALLTAILLLMGIIFLDRWRQPEQLGALNRSFQEMAEAGRAQTDEIRKLRAAIESRPVQVVVQAPPAQIPAVTPAQPIPTQPVVPAPVGPAPTKDAVADGKPKLGVNFLLPLDRSYIDPQHMGGTLRSFASTPKGLNPLTENEQTANDANELCNESLCDRSPKTPELWSSLLAESCIISDDFKTYTFTLRKGIRWQIPPLATKPEFAWLRQDVELTAEDFAFAVRLIMDPKVDCEPTRSYFEDIDRCVALDRYTVQVTWKKKTYTSMTCSLGLTPLPRHIYGRNRDGSAIPEDQIGILFNKHWFTDERQIVGVGDYQLVEFVPDKVMRFRRNPAYWTTPSSHFDEREWNMEVKQPEPQLVAFKNGQVQASVLSPLKYRSEVLDRKEPRFAAFDPADPKAGRTGELGWEACKRMAFSYIGWNNRRALFTDRRVRQAMSMAFPKERIIRDVFVGLGLPILSDVHPDSASYNAELKPYAFDLVKAKALLTEAGWTDSDGDGLLDHEQGGKRVPFRFTVSYYANSPEWDNTLSIFRTELKTIGVELAPKSFEWKELLRIYEDRDFDAVVGTWGMSFDLDFYQLWHSSQIDTPNGSNHCGFKNPHVDALAVQLRGEFEMPKRIAIAKEIQRLIHDDQPYTFFMSPRGIFCWQNLPPAGSSQSGRFLDGVTKGLDELHPLKNRSSLHWFFRQ